MSPSGAFKAWMPSPIAGITPSLFDISNNPRLNSTSPCAASKKLEAALPAPRVAPVIQDKKSIPTKLLIEREESFNDLLNCLNCFVTTSNNSGWPVNIPPTA